MINETELNQIDLSSLSNHIIDEEFKNYFLNEPGKDHYILLAYYSLKYNNSSLLDIGTYTGCSALALSYNPTNKIISFDVKENLRRLKSSPENIEFIIDNCIKEQYKKLILSSPFIMLDTDHDGIFEHEFYNYLCEINWKGILLLDDIHLNNPMKEFWLSISQEKHDISNVGHYTGTGLVIFK